MSKIQEGTAVASPQGSITSRQILFPSDPLPFQGPYGATTHAPAVYVSVQPPPDQSEWDKPSTWISLFAALVSVAVVFYTFLKDKGDKKKSIEDDYWIRQVVGPIAIEPLLKEILSLISSAPGDASNTSFSVQSVDVYHTQYLEKLADLAVNASSLRIVDAHLAATTAAAIDEIQDLMIDYCFENKNMFAAGSVVPGFDRNTYQDSVKAKLINLLTSIREFQVRKIA